MSKFLNDFLITMPETQRKKIIELLEIQQKAGLIRSSQEFQIELERLLLKINEQNGGPTFQAIPQSEDMNSRSFNKNMEAIAFDLSVLFEASSTIDRLMSENQQLSRSLLSGIKKNLHMLQGKIDRHKLLIKNADNFIDSIHESFQSPEYTETNEKELEALRKSRFDKPLGAIYHAEQVGKALQLAGVETIDQLKTNYGRKLAKIQVTNRIGHSNNHPQNNIEKAIDGSFDTYWAENILVDQPILQDVNHLWGYQYEGIPKDGSICEVEILLNGITTVSDVHFDPFCDYPLEIVSIYGYETEDSGGKRYELISPHHSNPHQRSQKSVHRMTFQFPSVSISKLHILLRQENYVKENYIVNEEELKNEELWRSLSSKAISDDFKKPNETIASFDKKNEVTGWSVYLEKLKEWASSVNQTSLVESAKKAMNTIQMGDYKNPFLLKLQSLSPNKEVPKELSTSWKAVNKLSYLYGAYDISVFGRKYQRESIYITKPLPLSSSTVRISLDTDEKHHDLDIGSELGVSEQTRVTDIEYYLTHKKNPTATDWVPILPIHKKYVRGELLSGDLITTEYPEFQSHESAGDVLIKYSFRFPVASKETVVLRRNGIPMNPSTYVITDDGKKIAIFSKYYMASSIYTVDYQPTEEAFIYDLHRKNEIPPTQYIDQNGETGEVFSKADHNRSVTLHHKPYLFREKLFHYHKKEQRYEQKEVTGKDPEYPVVVRVNGEEYLNITNYVTNSYNVKDLEKNEGKTFAQIGNQLIFGAPNDQRPLENITVDYYYVATDIRMKAILRRNTTEDESITPSLYSYHIRCQSYDQEV